MSSIIKLAGVDRIGYNSVTATVDGVGANLALGFNEITSTDNNFIVLLPVPKQAGELVTFHLLSGGSKVEIRIQLGTTRTLSINGTTVQQNGAHTKELSIDAGKFGYCVTSSNSNWEVHTFSVDAHLTPD